MSWVAAAGGVPAAATALVTPTRGVSAWAIAERSVVMFIPIF